MMSKFRFWISVVFFLLLIGSGSFLSFAQTTASVQSIPMPRIPDRVFNILKFGAVSDAKVHSTVAIQKAIVECAKAGGGTVEIPPGEFLTGPLTLTSNLNFQLDEGAKLLISNNPADFKLANGRYENIISANKCHDIAITGRGTIDGQGEFWWKNFVRPKDAGEDVPTPAHRPFLIQLLRCQRVLVRDITLTNSPMFHLVPDCCQDVTIEGVHFLAPARAPNTDALDPSGWNFFITKCVFDVGDDCIAIKATKRIDPARASCENFLVTNCTFLHGHGLSIGGQSNGGLKHLVVRDCTFENTDAGIRMKANRGSGGLVEDASYDNLMMKNVKVAIFITSYYPKIPLQPSTDPVQLTNDNTPIWRNIRITNVRASGGATAGRIIGLPEMAVSDIFLKNVNIAADQPLQIVNARNIVFENSQISVTRGAPITLEKAEIKGINAATGK